MKKLNLTAILEPLIVAGIIALYSQNLSIAERLARVETKLEMIEAKHVARK